MCLRVRLRENFNIVPMENAENRSEPILCMCVCITIDSIPNADANANADVTCKQGFTVYVLSLGCQIVECHVK